MDIHEYQAKELLSGFGVAVAAAAASRTRPIRRSIAAARSAAAHWVVKAQIHSGRARQGGRHQAVSDLPRGARRGRIDLLGKQLVTHQTGPAGKIVQRLYVEAAVPIERELYIGLVLDRRAERVCVVAAPEGGMEIEEIAAQHRPRRSASES